MISNKKKSSIKSLNKNNMPLFDNIEGKNEGKQLDSKANNQSQSIKLQNSNINTSNRSTTNSKIATDKPKSLTSLTSNSNNTKLSQNRNSVQSNPINAPKSPSVSHNLNSSISGSITLGVYLQEARVKAAYSINQVAMITKLNIHYIEAIERDDYKNTPPLIYIKAYIKKLATLYKIDVEKALNLLNPPNNNDKQIPSKLIKELQETKQVNQKDEAKIKMILQISTVVLLVIILICLIVGLVYWFSSGSSSETISTNNTTSTSESKSLKPLTLENQTEVSKEMEKLIVPQSVKLTELQIPQK